MTSYYSTTPIAKQNKVADQNGNVKTSITYFYGITNFNDLVADDAIVLGKDIQTKSPAFYSIYGPKIINNYYYYVRPLGDKRTVYVTQEISNMSNGQMTTVDYNYYDASDALYEGNVYEKHIVAFETYIEGGENNAKLDILSGQTSNIITNYLISGATHVSGDIYSFEFTDRVTPRTFYFKASANDINKRVSLYTSSSCAIDTMTTYTATTYKYYSAGNKFYLIMNYY